MIRGPTSKAIGNRDPIQRVNYQISLYPPYEKEKIGKRVRKRHQEISGEVGNLERTKDGLTIAKVILISPRGAALPTIGQTKLSNLIYDLTYSHQGVT